MSGSKPVHLCHCSQPIALLASETLPRQHKLTILLPPTTKVLVQVETRLAVSHLDVREPLGNDIEQRRIQTNRHADNGDNNPGLRRIVALPELISPSRLAFVVQANSLFPPRLALCLFSRSILYPIYRSISVLGFGARFAICIPIVVKSYKGQYSVTNPPRMELTSYLLISAISSSINAAPVGAAPPKSPFSALEKAEDRRETTEGRLSNPAEGGARLKDDARTFMASAKGSWCLEKRFRARAG